MERGPSIIALLFLLCVIAMGMVLMYAQPVILPLIIAWLLSYILGPIVNFMTRRRIPTGLAIAIVLLLVLGICYLGAIFLHARISAFVAVYPKYEARLAELLSTLTQRLEWGRESIDGIDWGAKVGQFLVKLSGSLVTFLSQLFMVIIFLVFLLQGKPYFHHKIKHAFSERNAEYAARILDSISTEIGRYLSIQFLISFATGILVWAALTVIRVDFAVTWGALAFFLNFIPTIGSIIASVPPILLAIVQFYPNYWPAAAAAVAMLTIQTVLGNVIAPKLMGDRLNLSPVVVLLSLVFWGWLWGGVGAILSIPIASAIKITCENIAMLKPIAVMMGSGKAYANASAEG